MESLTLQNVLTFAVKTMNANLLFTFQEFRQKSMPAECIDHVRQFVKHRIRERPIQKMENAPVIKALSLVP